jgi:undecaprenyl pyrophosphate phosphatase UppP
MKSESVRPFVIGMLALQAATVVLLWLLDAFSAEATAAFAFLLAANVMAFALVAHVYRTSREEDKSSQATARAD